MSPEADLLKRIKSYLRTHKLSETTFGSRAVGDCGLVSDLKKGRELRRKTAQKIEAFLAAGGEEAPIQSKRVLPTSNGNSKNSSTGLSKKIDASPEAA